MEKRFTPITGKRPYHFALDLVKQKTSLKEDEAILVFDLFIFFIRKYLFLRRELSFVSFGKMKIVFFKRKGNVFDFRAHHATKHVVNNKIPHVFDNRKFQNPKKTYVTEIIKTISKILRIDRKKVAFLINIFLYSLVEELAKNKVAKLRFFAFFYVTKYNFNRITAFGLDRKITGVNMIKTRAIKNFRDELNNKSTTFKTSKRLIRIFSKIKVSNEIKLCECL
jgi:nucleoid DNA-binding protein